MNWLEVLRQLRAARVAAFADSDRVGGSITAQVEDSGYAIRVIGPIDWWFGVDVIAVAEELMEQQPKVVNLYIDSPGGDLFDAMALRAALDTLAESGTVITARAGGIVGSAAVQVFLTGATRTAQSYTRFMVHSPRAVFSAGGTLDALRASFENFAGTVTAATGLYWDAISSHVEASIVAGWRASNQDVWLTADESRTVGLLSAELEEPVPGPDATARVDAVRAQLIHARIRATLGR